MKKKFYWFMALVLVFCMPVGCRSGSSAGDPPQHKGMTSVGESFANGDTAVNSESSANGDTSLNGESSANGDTEANSESSANGDTAANSESSVNVDSPMIDATETDAETAVTDESALPFYTLECPDSVVLGIYSWNDRIVLYTYNEGKYDIVCMDADSGEVLARTQDGYDHHVWLDFSAPVTPENEQAGFAEFTESETQTGGDTIFDSVIQTEKNILIEDDIFNSDSPAEENGQGRQLSDVPLPDQPQIAGNAPVQAPNPAAPQTADDAPASLQPHKFQLRIYDPQTQSFIWLDDALNAIKSWTMPDAVTSNPLMDSDNAYVYYVNSDGDVLRLEVATGQSTKLEIGLEPQPEPNLEGIYNNGTLLKASGMAVDENGPLFVSNYIDVAKNQVIASHSDFSALSGREDNYLIWLNNQLSQIVCGTYSDESHINELIFENYSEYQSMFAFPDDRKVFTYHNSYLEDGTSRGILSMYSLENGTCPARFELSEDMCDNGNNRPLYLVYLPESGRVVYAVSSERPTLYVWNTQTPESQSGDNGIYKQPYMAEDVQDADAFEQLKAKAASLGEQYGVEIYIGEDAPTKLWGYTAEHVTSVRLTQRALMILRQALASYPDNFFKQLYNEAQGPLRFYILCNFKPDGSDSLSTTTGLFSQDSTQQYVALNVRDLERLETLIYHEVSHAIDNKLFGISNQTFHSEDWDLLNPEGFVYDFGYQSNAQSMDWSHVYGGNVFMENPGNAYFIDTYSKSYPTEDRARIMEYAMGFYPESKCFGEEYLWKKLDYVCKDIRRNFDTTEWPSVTRWERPLQQPLN